MRNTPILVARHAEASGEAIEVCDFCPRFSRRVRTYRPVAFARIVRPVSGSPRICVRLRPVRNWGRGAVERTRGSNHLRYLLTELPLGLPPSPPVARPWDEQWFGVGGPLPGAKKRRDG